MLTFKLLNTATNKKVLLASTLVYSLTHCHSTSIAMIDNELINNLEIFAKPCNNAFMEAMAAGGDISMIGQLDFPNYFVSAKVL